MKLFIIHHHLNPGGVTRIIESQIFALGKVLPGLKITIITGEDNRNLGIHDSDIEIIEYPQINYLPDNLSKEKLISIYREILNFFNSHVTHEDILHIHNLNLGKNPLLTLAIYELAQKGIHIVNHAHDFAEDRPVNLAFLEKIIGHYFEKETKKIMYPEFSDVLFAVLNSFDYERLKTYGIPEKRRFLLPNPVTIPSPLKTHEKNLREDICTTLGLNPDKRIVTYPVRVIRRKNIGEFILLSALFSDKATWVVTQPPKNPVEIEEYEIWKQFCLDHNIRVFFEAGTKVNFIDLMSVTDFTITTSIQEGFGMTYMEPWLMDLPVKGRNIGYITKDLIHSGIRFPLLYDHFMVNFNHKETDFKDLNTKDKQKFISGVIINTDSKKELFALNPFLNSFMKEIPKELINKNKEVILSKYSPENYGQRLHEIYKKFTG